MLLRGKYRVAKVLGHGGMGVVVEAMHLDLERRVAIKILHAELHSNTELVERFVREGRAASRIEGDHVARVFDVDRLEDGTPFLVMEYLDGQDLSYVRRSQTPLPTKQAIGYVLQACSGVALAHAAGVIHRDVKPANLFVTADARGEERVKVLDFGISKLSGPGGSEPSVTRTTLVMGSVEYMSPEQMLSTRDVDVRTDVWALGVVLFELLTAAPPFSGENTTQICAHVMSQPAVRPKSLRADLPDELEEIIMRCLEKDRDKRYSTVDELSAALRAFLASAKFDDAPVTAPIPPPTFQPPTPLMPGNTPVPSPYPSQPPLKNQSSPDVGGSNPRLAMPTTILPEGQLPVDTGKPQAPAKSGTRISLGVPSVSTASTTTVGVASDPVPPPPRNKSSGLLYAVLACAGLIIPGGLWLSTRSPGSGSDQTTTANQVSVSPTAGTTEPTQTTGSLSGSPSVAVAPSASGAPTVTVEPAITTKPTPTPTTAPSTSAPAAKTSKPAATERPLENSVTTARPTTTGYKPPGID
jgi:serine/threonine-protein kinase